MNRSALLGVVTALALVACSGERAGPAPNVMLVVIDTLRADHLHGYGYARETSPHLDRLMAAGARFEQAIVPSSWSAPSHVTIATGANPHRHQVMTFGQTIHEDVSPVAVHLQKRGYETGLFSSHLALHQSVGRLTDGLDHATVLDNESDAEVLRQASQWVRERTGPWFAYICLMTAHAPYDKHPAHYDEQFFNDPLPGAERRFPFVRKEWIGEGGIPKSVRIGNHDRLGFYVNRYDRGIRYVDELFGAFWKEIEASGASGDTLLVITSDHGEGLGEHDTFAHELYLFEFLVRVPLIFHYPAGLPGGQVHPGPATSADIVPTILGFVGASVRAAVDGLDFSSALRDGTPIQPDRLLTGSYRHRGYDRYMVRSSRHKLLVDARRMQSALYDLENDPGETTQLEGTTDVPDEARRALWDRMNELLALHRKVPSERVPIPLSDGVLEELRALGYVD